VVLTFDGAQFLIYNNGAQVAAGSWGGFVPNRNGATVLGWRTDRDWRPFQGVMDDVAFYNKALTPAQVANHYSGTIRLSIAKVGSQVVVTWPFGTLQESLTVSGIYADLPSATSPFTNAPSGTAKFYRVKIPN
jgi:hypothetical protein